MVQRILPPFGSFSSSEAEAAANAAAVVATANAAAASAMEELNALNIIQPQYRGLRPGAATNASASLCATCSVGGNNFLFEVGINMQRIAFVIETPGASRYCRVTRHVFTKADAFSSQVSCAGQQIGGSNVITTEISCAMAPAGATVIDVPVPLVVGAVPGDLRSGRVIDIMQISIDAEGGLTCPPFVIDQPGFQEGCCG